MTFFYEKDLVHVRRQAEQRARGPRQPACVKQACRERARSTAGGNGSRTVCDHYQLIRERVSPFPVSDRLHASAQKNKRGGGGWVAGGVTAAPNALWHELQTAERASGKPICLPSPHHSAFILMFLQ